MVCAACYSVLPRGLIVPIGSQFLLNNFVTASPTLAPTASPTATGAIVEPSKPTVSPTTDSTSGSPAFGAGAAVAVGLAGAFILASALVLGRRKLRQKEASDGSTASDMQTHPADMQSI